MEIKFDNVTLVMNRNTLLEKTILKNVSFEIKDRGIYTFLGTSNSGKSSIGDLITALNKPTSGIVKINEFINNGRIIKNINNLRRDTGYVFRNPYDMFFNNNVKNELVFGMKYFKYKVASINKRVKDALKLVGLSEDYLDYSPFDLNLIEAKKLSLAVTLVYNPKILILDEITNGLTKSERNEIIRIIRILKNKYEKTIILLTKDTSFAYEISDYIYLMNRCSIVESGKKDILENTELLSMLGLEIPVIIEFVNISRNKGHELKYHTTTSELLKEVYRNVH